MLFRSLKKIITAFLILTLVLTSVPTVAYAADSRPTTEKPIELAPLYIDGRNKTPDEINQEIQAYIDSQINNLPTSSRVRDYYKTLVYPSVERTVDEIVGNQPSKYGYRFPTGGGFFYCEDGGPEATISFSVSLASGKLPIGVSVGVSLGYKADTLGMFVRVPDKEHYYKLAVRKKVEIHPVGVYRVPYNNAPVTANCHLAYTMKSVVVLNVDPYARRIS